MINEKYLFGFYAHYDYMSISKIFKSRLLELVNETNENTTTLNKLMKVDYRSFYHAIEYGIIPSTRILLKIANYFQASIDFLIGKTDNENFYYSENGSTFFSRISELCTERKITFYKVEKDCHFYKGYIKRWIKNKSFPELDSLEILADYFYVSLDYILGRTDDRD